MALELNIISYQCSGVAGGHKPGERIAKATFRGVSHLSKTFEDQGDRASRVSQVGWEIHNAPSCLTRIERLISTQYGSSGTSFKSLYKIWDIVIGFFCLSACLCAQSVTTSTFSPVHRINHTDCRIIFLPSTYYVPCLHAATVVADRVDDPPARGDGGADTDLQPVPRQPAPRLHHLLPPQAARRVYHQGRLQSINLV